MPTKPGSKPSPTKPGASKPAPSKPGATKPANKTNPSKPAKSEPEVVEEVVTTVPESAAPEAPKADKKPAAKGKEKAAEKSDVVEVEPVKGAQPESDNEEVGDDTNPENYLFKVRVDNKTFDGRDVDQVASLVYGVLGAASKITIDRVKR